VIVTEPLVYEDEQAEADGMYFVPKAADRGWQVMRDFLAEKLKH
jgi:hypothetical protein